MRQLYSHDYRAAGLGTLARQMILGGVAFMPYAKDPLVAACQLVLKSVAHTASMAIKTLENVSSMSIILTEQAAYPLLLQTSHEMDKLMASQIPLERKQLAVFKTIHPLFAVTSPLAFLSLGNYIEALTAQIHCHQTVLNHFNSMWTWVEKTEVTYVVDGDTIYVAEYPGVAIRLEGINCPEIWHEGEGDPDDSKWDAGNAAKEFTETELLGKEVKLRARTERDVYGRIVAKVFYPDDKNFSWTIMAAGHAKLLLSTWFF